MDFLRKTLGIQENDEKLKHDDFSISKIFLEENIKDSTKRRKHR